MQLSIVITSRGKLIEETFADKLIRQAMSSPQGKSQLAKSMMNPIRRGLDYQGIARRALVVEQMPLPSSPVYYRDEDEEE
jgi:hypothetical protein